MTWLFTIFEMSNKKILHGMHKYCAIYGNKQLVVWCCGKKEAIAFCFAGVEQLRIVLEREIVCG